MWPVSRLMRRVDVHSECLSSLSSLSDVERLLEKFPSNKFFPIVHHLRGGVDAMLMGSVTRDALEEIKQTSPSQHKWEKDLIVDFLDPLHWQKGHPLHGQRGHQQRSNRVNRMPLHVSPQTPIEDVYLLLKVMWYEEVVY